MLLLMRMMMMMMMAMAMVMVMVTTKNFGFCDNQSLQRHEESHTSLRAIAHVHSRRVYHLYSASPS